jgi:hypothetical protein
MNSHSLSQSAVVQDELEKYIEGKESIRKYLNHLNDMIRKRYGQNNKYKSPVPNPYVFSDAADYKLHILGNTPEEVHIDRHVKLINVVSQTTDPGDRYYTAPTSETECAKLNGVWEANATNRTNKYDRGVCWTSKQQARCGTAIPTDLLRPYPRTQDAVKDGMGKCTAVPGCNFARKTKFTYDCEADPPDEVPVLPLKKDLEDFIYEWYKNRIVNRPPPVVSQLIGVGNRCVASAPSASTLMQKQGQNHDIYAHKAYRNFRTLNPANPKDARELLQHMNANELKSYRHHYNMVKTYGIARYREIYSANRAVYTNFHHDLDASQFEYDEQLTKTKPQRRIADVAPSVPQSVVNSIMKDIAQREAAPAPFASSRSSKQQPPVIRRGLIAVHSVGSGKTCTAAGVMEALWDSPRDIIFASSVDALTSNPPYKFHECCMNFHPRWMGKDMNAMSAEFERRDVRFLSFAKLANRIMKFQKSPPSKGFTRKERSKYVDLNNTILIIDEVHNLFRPIATQKKQYDFLQDQLTDPSKHPTLKIVILTATPGDNVPDIMKLLNMVRVHMEPVIVAPDTENALSVEAFKQQIRGMVSYFDSSSDTTKFPVVHDNDDFIKVPMTDAQFIKYIDAYKKVTDTQKNYEQLAKGNQLARYWEPARKYANSMFSFDNDMQLSEYSAKLPALLEEIAKYPNEKQYVYSAFYTKMGYGGHGAVGIAKELDKLGYVKLTVDEAKRHGAALAKGKRYVLAISSEVGTQLDICLRVFNDPKNKTGDYVHLVVASQGFNEGIDLKAVRHIHFFEPLVTMASDKQTIGRAARYCSHSALDRDAGEWTVAIHRYMTDKPITMSVTLDEVKQKLAQALARAKAATTDVTRDRLKAEIATLREKQKQLKKMEAYRDVPNVEELIFKESRARVKEIFTIYQCLKEAAVDCKLLNAFHASTGTTIKCVT